MGAPPVVKYYEYNSQPIHLPPTFHLEVEEFSKRLFKATNIYLCTHIAPSLCSGRREAPRCLLVDVGLLRRSFILISGERAGL